ncbi:toxin-antitoxin system YwqK family antitoxin [Gammaproteobacteria bacterium]|nr:toxin-antitoxin system YwqK family antitoxin [Gammaproteobacteria bacterium]
MKIILPIILLFSMISTPIVFGEESYEMSELVERDGLYYKKFTDIPFTGTVTGKEQGTLKDGKKADGLWITYHDNGQLQSKVGYKNHLLDGPWIWYHENGQISTKGNYKKNGPDGLWVYYHENGQLKSETNKKDGWSEGPAVGYHENGQLSIRGTYKNSQREGTWVFYYDNGQLLSKGNYKGITPFDVRTMQGLWVSYHENGQLASEINYKDGKKHGSQLCYEEDGQLWKEGSYRNGEKSWEHSYRNGISIEKLSQEDYADLFFRSCVTSTYWRWWGLP